MIFSLFSSLELVIGDKFPEIWDWITVIAKKGKGKKKLKYCDSFKCWVEGELGEHFEKAEHKGKGWYCNSRFCQYQFGMSWFSLLFRNVRVRLHYKVPMHCCKIGPPAHIRFWDYYYVKFIIVGLQMKWW